MKSPQQNVKRVKEQKGYAVLVDGCCITWDANGTTLALAIYPTKKDALKRDWPLTRGDKIIPVTITYKLPLPVKGKKKN